MVSPTDPNRDFRRESAPSHPVVTGGAEYIELTASDLVLTESILKDLSIPLKNVAQIFPDFPALKLLSDLTCDIKDVAASLAAVNSKFAHEYREGILIALEEATVGQAVQAVGEALDVLMIRPRLETQGDKVTVPDQWRQQLFGILNELTAYLDGDPGRFTACTRPSIELSSAEAQEMTERLRVDGLAPEGGYLQVRGNSEEHYFQIIGYYHGSESRDPWLIWNSNSGGYFHPYPDSYSVRFTYTYPQGGSFDVHGRFLEWKNAISRIFVAHAAGNPDFREYLFNLMPRLDVSSACGRRLRAVEYSEPSRWGPGGDISAEVSGRDRRETYPLAFLVNRYSLVSTTALGFRNEGWDTYHLERFLRSWSISEARNFTKTLRGIGSKREELQALFEHYFTTRTSFGSSSSSEKPVESVLPYFFNNWNPGRLGMPNPYFRILYEPPLMREGLVQLKLFCDKYGDELPWLTTIGNRVAPCLETELFPKIDKIIYRMTGKSSRVDSDFDMSTFLEELSSDELSDEYRAGLLDSYLNAVPFRNRRSEEETQRLQYGAIDCLVRESETFSKSVEVLYDALLRVEYLLLWSRFSCDPEQTLVFAEEAEGNRALTLSRLESLPLKVLQQSGHFKQPVVPVSLHLTIDDGIILASGTNLGGKTSLLEAVGWAVLGADRGIPIHACEASIPRFSGFSYLVNTANHTQVLSSHQADMQALAHELNHLRTLALIEDSEAGLFSGVLLADELGRGTSALDGQALLAGLMVYCKRHGILLLASTHLNDFSNLQPFLAEHGVNPLMITLAPDSHEIVPSRGRSYGIEAAEELHHSPEIIELAYRARGSHRERDVRQFDRVEPFTDIQALSILTLEELGIITQEKDGNRLRYVASAGPALQELIEQSPLSRRQWRDNSLRSYWRALPAATEAALLELLLRPISEDELRQRIELLSFLSGRKLDYQMTYVSTMRSSLSELFGVAERERCSVTLPHQMVVPKVNSPKLRDDHQRHLDAKSALERGVIAPNQFFKWFNLFTADWIKVGEGGSVLAHDLASKLQRLRENSDFTVLASEARRIKWRNLSFTNWQTWEQLCRQSSELLLEIRSVLDRCHNWTMIAETIRTQRWTEAIRTSSRSTLTIRNCRNLALQTELEEVCPISLSLDERLTTMFSGTNGGGKTQALKTIGLSYFLANQLGFLPAEYAEIGTRGELLIHLHNGTHGQGRSSFQDELRRISSLVVSVDQMVSPDGTVLIIDDPYVGTSEDDAVALLIGLRSYCEKRGVRLVATTHFSSFFEKSRSFDQQSSVQPLSVDALGREHNYQIFEGIRPSSGIEIARRMGLPREILEIAEQVSIYLSICSLSSRL